MRGGEGKDIADHCLQGTYVAYARYCRMNFCEPLSWNVILLGKDSIEAV